MRTIRNCRLFYALPLAASLLATPAAGADVGGPWSVSSSAPVTGETAASRSRAATAGPPEGLLAAAALGALAFYQAHLSPLDGSRCPMQPTCSRYAVEAIREHGPLAGFVLTADRVLHEPDEQRLAPRVRAGDRFRAADPVSANDWLFRQR